MINYHLLKLLRLSFFSQRNLLFSFPCLDQELFFLNREIYNKPFVFDNNHFLFNTLITFSKSLMYMLTLYISPKLFGM